MDILRVHVTGKGGGKSGIEIIFTPSIFTRKVPIGMA